MNIQKKFFQIWNLNDPKNNPIGVRNKFGDKVIL